MAPIILFVFSRLEHTRLTVNSLLKNKLVSESELFIFSDGAKFDHQLIAVQEVRKYIHQIKGFKTVTIIEREYNYGLSNSIIDGVTSIVNQYGKVIVLEDDLITSPYFLKFMNEGLDKYANDDRVISIHGYVYPCKKLLPDAFFLPGADCWGWATWRRGWDLFNSNGRQLLDEISHRKLTSAFNYNEAYSFTGMLEDQISGRNDSWAIRWHAAAFLAGKLTLYPGKSLVNNIGHDNSGTHCGDDFKYQTIVSDSTIDLGNIKVETSRLAWRAFEQFLRGERTFSGKIVRKFLSYKLSKKFICVAKQKLNKETYQYIRNLFLGN